MNGQTITSKTSEFKNQLIRIGDCRHVGFSEQHASDVYELIHKRFFVSPGSCMSFAVLDAKLGVLATFHGDDKMEEDSGSVGLIGEVVGLGDRIKEEQMHTGNKEHSLNSHDPVDHVCEPRPNTVTTAEPPFKVFSKSVSKTDIESRLSFPTHFLHNFPVPEGSNLIEFQVIDTRGKLWKFKLSFRSGSGAYRKPVITGEWLSFVKDKGVQVGDTVTIFKQNNGTNECQYSISVTRRVFNVLATLPA
ncbi:hypothetical protein POTOM_049780 [Populus tomentosa]|uniref:TF-B3 domain-containing protein n=1 Tax=Populus tomentosa TaxID=118781 RepID=A0A8X7YAV4_POPTO|nr:hypothetical protein POTOM_049780 [Populus tomentosa]